MWWIALLPLLAIVVIFLWRFYVGVFRKHRELARRRVEFVRGKEPRLEPACPGGDLRTEFDKERIVTIDHFVTGDTLEALRAESFANAPRVTRSYIPTHKKGGTVSYEQLHESGPRLLAFFHSPEVHSWLSSVVGAKVVPTADHDQSTCSLLMYAEAGDHINWHYDHNFYKGRHFTVLLSIHNRSAGGGLSAGKLQRKLPTGAEQSFDMPENSLVLFEGAKTLHRATPIADGDTRVMLSMTYATDPRISWYKEIVRRCKDVAFYGLKALWK